MNTYIFLYPETSFFEVNLVAYFMKTKGDVYIVAEDEYQTICTNEGIKIQKDVSVTKIDLESIDIFIICGGDIGNIKNKQVIYNIIRWCNENNKIIGGICAGRDIVLDAIGEYKKTAKTSVSNNIILSPGNEYVEFALMVGKTANIFEDDKDFQETVDYFKYFKYVE